MEALLRMEERPLGMYSLVRVSHLPLSQGSMLHRLLKFDTLPGNSYRRSMGTQQNLSCFWWNCIVQETHDLTVW